MTNLTRRSLLAKSFIGLLASILLPSQKLRAAATPWRNWSGNLVSHPAGRFSPSTEFELQEYLKKSETHVRPVGAGHSFSPLVPTDGNLIVLDQLSGLIDYDSSNLQATFGAGTRLSDIGGSLDEIDQAMLNLPDIDRQTLAGATATATHGTGIGFTCLSGFITALRLITPRGNVMDLKAGDELFNAARVSLGSLGVITRMTIQNRTPYKLKANNWVQRTEEVLETFDETAAKHRHFEMFPLTHSNYALVLAIDETHEAIDQQETQPQEDDGSNDVMATWAKVPPRERMPLIDAVAQQIPPTTSVDHSYRILSNIRNDRFNEMEYSVPLEHGADCLREILRTIIDKEVDVVFPLEYRYVRRDDTWLSMSSGDEDHAAISIHRTAGQDFKPYFELIEPIFWKFGGRPHWGKIHSLGAKQLADLYPHFKAFQAVRSEVDPDGRMLNDHLRKIFVA